MRKFFTDTAEWLFVYLFIDCFYNSCFGNVPVEYSALARKLKPSYVDNSVTGVNSIEQEKNFIGESTQISSRGCLNLRGWESNVKCKNIARSTDITDLLGVRLF